MLLLAFETSCDDTSIAVFRNRELVAMKTRSQIREHNETKWVVPEVAARLHANNVFGVLEEVLSEADVALEDLDIIACTEFPGLMPSLLVGISVARTLAHELRIPYVPIDHIEAHMFANFIGRDVKVHESCETGKYPEKWWSLHENRSHSSPLCSQPEWAVRNSTVNEEAEIWVWNSHFADISPIPFPCVCLTVSGGHNELYLWKSMFEREKIGETLDDSAGEAFDKVARMLGLWYPGGPIIGKMAGEYIGTFRGIFPEVLLDRNGHDFSFSGLKSAVKREVDKRVESRKSKVESPNDRLSLEDIREIAFEFEQTVVNILTYKLFHAAETYDVPCVVLAGGVSANDRLRETIERGAQEKGYRFIAPVSKTYSQDNAAMVGILAYYRYIKENSPLA